MNPTANLRARARLLLVPLCLGAVLSPRAAAGQELADSLVERRVRLELVPLARSIEGHTDPQVVRGTVLALGADSLHIRIHDAAAPFGIATGAIAHIDVSHGVRTELESAARGFARGAGTGALQWGLFNGFRKDPLFQQSFLQSAIAGAVVGGLIGSVVGWIRPEERWHRLR